MATLYFITEVYLKNQTGISLNVDSQDIMPHVQVASDLYMSLVLGQEYYDYLLVKYNAQTLSATELLLVEHIQPSVAWRAGELALPFSAIQIKNKGPQVQSGDFSSAPDRGGLNTLIHATKGRAEYYENRVKRFLKLNKIDYPLWTAASNLVDTPPDKRSSWDGNGLTFI